MPACILPRAQWVLSSCGCEETFDVCCAISSGSSVLHDAKVADGRKPISHYSDVADDELDAAPKGRGYKKCPTRAGRDAKLAAACAHDGG